MIYSDLKGFHLLTQHLEEAFLVFHPMRWCLWRNLNEKQINLKIALFFSCFSVLFKWEKMTARTYQMSLSWRNYALVGRGSGKLQVRYCCGGFSGMSRAGVGWSFLAFIILFIYGPSALNQLLVHIVQKIHNFLHGNRNLYHKWKQWLLQLTNDVNRNAQLPKLLQEPS